MAHAQQADPRSSVLLPALVAAAVSILISVSGVFISTQLMGSTANRPTATGASAQLAAAVDNGRIWEMQRQQQSVDAIRLERARAILFSPERTQGNMEWTLRYWETSSDR
jgi:hypothetical protein